MSVGRVDRWTYAVRTSLLVSSQQDRAHGGWASLALRGIDGAGTARVRSYAGPSKDAPSHDNAKLVMYCLSSGGFMFV
jgi:hypothetical protein